jgi:hypothetical protein
MAGLAEAGLAFALLIGLGGLLLAGVAALLGWGCRSPAAALVAVLLVCLVGLCLTPWEALGPVESDDPDVDAWIAMHRAFIVLWALTGAAALAATFRALREVPAEPPPGDGLPARPGAEGPDSGARSTASPQDPGA